MATKLSSPIQAVPLALMASETTQSVALGTKVWSDDGRAFRYVKAGATPLVQGKLQQAGPEDTAHQNLAVAAAAAIGDTTVTVTVGASAVLANEYAEGFLIVTTTPGEGYQYKIKSHPANAGSASLVVTLEDPIEVALTTSSVVDLVLNPYSAVIVDPQTSKTSSPVGVAVYPIPASNYGWLQVEGIASILADGALAVGTGVVASNGIVGAVEDVASTTQPVIGSCVTGVADTEYGAILLNLE